MHNAAVFFTEIVIPAGKKAILNQHKAVAG